MYRPTVVDLFCGMGGLSYGFKLLGVFKIKGVDINHYATLSYRFNNIGETHTWDIRSKFPRKYLPLIVVGGPPCKPWSAVNVRLRRRSHPDYSLISKFFEYIRWINLRSKGKKPAVVVLENVPPLRRDPILQKELEKMQKIGFSHSARVISYYDFGAASGRRRLFVVLVNENLVQLSGHGAEIIFGILEEFRNRVKRRRVVRDVISDLENVERNSIPDHEWPILKTIRRYINLYRTNKYGWYVLRWDQPAKSFGNIMKTYILHPSAWDWIHNGHSSERFNSVRVISVREAMRIMGFGDSFTKDKELQELSYIFPKSVPMSHKYQMVADAVSPIFSKYLAEAILKFLQEHGLM